MVMYLPRFQLTEIRHPNPNFQSILMNYIMLSHIGPGEGGGRWTLVLRLVGK